jgi:hypothetical protein
VSRIGAQLWPILRLGLLLVACLLINPWTTTGWAGVILLAVACHLDGVYTRTRRKRANQETQ